MKPKTKGRVAVGLIISIIAFGLGTGTAMFSGYYKYQTNLDINNTTQPGELPPIFTTTNPLNSSQNNPSEVQSNPSTNTEIKVENPSNESTGESTANKTNDENETP
jgi:hypothetical protein